MRAVRQSWPGNTTICPRKLSTSWAHLIRLSPRPNVC